MPQRLGLAGHRHAVAQPGEDEPLLKRHERGHGQRRHRAVDPLGVTFENAMFDRPLPHVLGRLVGEQSGEVAHGDAGDRGVEITVEAGGQRGHVPSQRHAVQHHRRGVLGTHPTEQAAHVPRRLSQCVYAVHHVEPEELFTAQAGRATAAVHRQDDGRHVPAQVVMQMLGPKGDHVSDGCTRAEPVHTHHPGARSIVVFKHPGGSRVVLLERLPPLCPRLLRTCVKVAVPADTPVALPERPTPGGDHVGQRSRIIVIAAGVVQPAALLEQRCGLLQLG